MNPIVIHRYSWPVREAIGALLGDAVGDCRRWDIRVESGELVIDVVEPAEGGANRNGDFAPHNGEKAKIPTPLPAESTSSNDTAKSDVAAEDRKGGPLARRAAMLCNEKGFWTFSETESAEEAAEWLRDLCGVKSRAELDHDPYAAGQFEKVDGKYRRWLQGYDD